MALSCSAMDSDDEIDDPLINMQYEKPVWRPSGRRGLKTALVCLSLVCVALLIALGVVYNSNHGSSGSPSPQPCVTAECVKTAATVLQAMDPTADPCDDFYQYACGSWMARNPLDETSSQKSRFGELYSANEQTLRSIVEGQRSDITVSSKVTDWYGSCMNTSAIDAEGDAVFKDEIVIFFETLPPQPLKDSLLHLQKNDIDFMFYASVGIDDKNVTRNAMFIGQSGLTLPSREYYIGKEANDPTLKAFRELLLSAFLALGFKDDGAHAAAAAVFDFESKLAVAFTPSEELRDPEASYNPMTVANLTQNYPFLPWHDFFADMFHNVSADAPERVVVSSPAFLEKLNVLLNATDASNLAYYFSWKSVQRYMSIMGPPYDDILAAYRELVSGATQSPPRWSYCIESVDYYLGDLLGRAFVEAAFAASSRDTAEEMVREIKTSFETHLPNWMDPVTAARAKEKAEAVVDKIGYPNSIMNDTFLQKEYENVHVVKSFFTNVRAARERAVVANLEELDKAVDRSAWGMTPPTVNAYYSPAENQIVFPAGILQPPFFSQHFPKSLNFGGMGVVIGHELTHGFDDQGREYDKDGDLHDWWEPHAAEEFEKRAQCIDDQYSAYEFYGEHINGRRTLGENIADNGGLTESYRAYTSWVAANGPEQALPGMSLSHEQLFFLGFAQVWCNNIRPEEARNRIATDPHSPGRFRVIGTLSNSVDFAKAYSCKAGSPMNPAKKCVVW
eukprot:m.60983 g.60983  ORF g.60983 m.60983 type:complete len:733 (+) comp7318_c0_seq2:201-2399(+)